MKKIIDAYHRLLIWLMVANVAILLIPVTMQIVARFTNLIPAYIWTEEASRFLFIWMIMLGAMIAIREGTHFEVDVWPELSPKGQALLRIVSGVFIFVFALVFVWWGIAFTKFGWNQTSEIADLPMWMIFIAWPMTGFTWVLFQGEAFQKNVRIFMNSDPQ